MPALFCALAAPLAAAPAGANDIPVALPPFIVDEIGKGPPWRYAQLEGYEVLSRCTDPVTRRVVDSHRRLHRLLAEILPPSLQFQTSQPRALIIYDEELQPAASQEVIRRMLRDQTIPDEEPAPEPFGLRGMGIRPPTTRRYQFLPNLRLWDRDAMSVFMIVRRDDFDADRLALTQDYVAFSVKSRVPPLPLWFISGFLDFYAQVSYAGDRLEVAPMTWIDTGATAAVKKDPKTAPPVQPLAEFFAGRIPVSDSLLAVEPVRLWQAQAALLVRWGLDPQVPERREAFWKFVERGAVEGVTEELFRRHLKLDYLQGQAQLAAHLPLAVTRTMRFRLPERWKLPRVELVNATDGQIARIKGDWERLEVPYVKNISADLAPKYLQQARRTLRRAYDRDERDPRLLAAMALCEIDAGDDAAGRELLEAAVRVGPLRPRACYELARLRFAAARTEAGNGLLTPAQAAEVLKPLFAAREAEPPLPEVYELIAAVWAHGVAVPTRRHLAVLDEGVRLFPRRGTLIVQTAEVYLRHGFRAEATAFARLALLGVKDAALQPRVAALQKDLGL